MASYKTIAQIVTAGLKDGGNPGISTRAQEFLIALLNHMDMAYDWHYNQAEADVTTSNRHEISLAGVTRYRNVAVVKLSTIAKPLEQMDYRDLWALLQEAIDKESNGTPAYFTPIPDRAKLLIFPRPPSDKTYSGKILYYRQPDPAAYVSGSFPAFEDVLALEAAVAAYAQRYDKEPMHVTVERLADNLWGRYRTMHGDKGRNKQQTMKWGSAYKPMTPQE